MLSTTKANDALMLDHLLMLSISGFALLLIGILVYWNMRLKRDIERKILVEKELKQLNSTQAKQIEKNQIEIRNREILIQHQSRLAQVGEIINMTIHQWKQPLGVVSAATSSIQSKIKLNKYNMEDKKDREAFELYLSEKLTSIQKYIHLMTNTVDDFRLFFRRDKIRELESVNEVINKALQIITPHLKAKNITLSKQLNSRKKIYLYSNELMQVILNLLKNSDDAFDELADKNMLINNKIITLHAYDIEDGVKVDFCDNAGGVPTEKVKKVFNPYFSTKKQNGTGLGLYMSKMIIEEHHNGVLKLENMKDGVFMSLTLYDHATIKKHQ